MRSKAMLTSSKGLLVFALAAILAQPVAAAGFELDAAKREKIDAEAQRLIDEQRAPGIAIGIMSEGQIIYAKGFGLANLETGTKVTPETVFMIGSITKQFTAAAIMLLAEEGKLAIDDPISKYFADFPKGNEVTIRQLLTHTSGIHAIMTPGTAPTPAQAVTLRSTADVIALIQGADKLYEFEPGTSFQYSNAGYWLLGSIVEKVSGDSLGDYFHQNLFRRAGMTATALDDRREVVPHRASGYNRAPDADVFTNPPSTLMNVRGGAGGIRSTVPDMLRWQDALLAGRIISLDGVKAMTTPGTTKSGEPLPQQLPNAPRYGFGLSLGSVNGHAFVAHGGGSTQGFTANLKAFPDDRVAFVVLTNISPSPRRQPPGQDRQNPDRQPSRPDQRRRRMQGGDGAAMELERFLTEMIAGPVPGQP